MKQENIEDYKIIGKQDILDLLGISASTLKNLETKGDFPKRILLIAGRVGWIQKDIITWIKTRPSGKGQSKSFETRKANGMTIPQRNGGSIKLNPESRDVISIP